MLEPRLFPECHRIHRQHAIGGECPAKPSFQLDCLTDVLLTGDLDTRLDLSDRHRWQKELIGGHIRIHFRMPLCKLGRRNSETTLVSEDTRTYSKVGDTR